MEVIKIKTGMLVAQVSDGQLLLGGLFDGLKVNVDKYKEIIDSFNKLDLNNKKFIDSTTGKANWDAITKAIGNCDETALSYFKTLEDGNGTINNQSASVEGLGAHLKATGNSFNFAAIKATLLNTALNAGIFLAVTVAVQGLIKVFDNWIHRVEKARERTNELFTEFKEMNNTLADHKKTVAELADRYDELSKGVTLYTNDNVSLSTEEYEEFLDINEQLAKSFPELAKGIDENGNSILTLGTKGITAKEQLEELLQTEEDLNNFKIAQELGDAFKGVYTYVEDANEATVKLNGSINDSSEAMGRLQAIAENGIKLSGDYNQLIFSGNTNNQAELDYMNALIESVNEFWKSLDGDRRVELSGLGIDNSTLFIQEFDEYTGAFELYSQAYNLSPDELTKLEALIQDNVKDASGALLDSISEQSHELQNQIQQGENAWRDFIPNLVSGMKSKQTFKDLDYDLQDIAVQIVEGLDYSYATAMKEWNPNDPYAYIRDNIIVPMGNLSDSDKKLIKDSFTELMTLDAEDISQNNQAEITKFINTIADLLKKDPLEIRVALGFDVEDIQNRYNEALKEAKRKLGGYGYDNKGIEINNTVGDKLDDFWNENVVTEEDWVLWKQVTDEITDAAKAMETYTEAKKNANAVDADETLVSLSISETIDQLNTQLKPAFDSLKSAYQDIFTDDGFALNSIDILSTCDSIKSKLGELSNIDGINVDYSAFEDFVRVLNNTESTEKDVEDAFDSLASSITQAALSGTEDFETMKAALEDLGVVNNEMVAFDALINNTEALKEAGLDLVAVSQMEADEADAIITAFANESVSAENVSQAIAMLTYQKELCNIQEMNTAGEVANLKTLAENAGYTGEVIQYLTELEQIYQEVANGTLNAFQVTAKVAKAVALKAMIEAAASKVNYEPKVDFSGATKAAKSAGKEAGKSYKEGLEEELSNLEGVISGVTKAIDKNISSIKTQKEEAVAAIDAQIDALNEQKSALEDQKKALEEERDARIEIIEQQKKQLELAIKAIDKQIKAKEKIIKSINDEIKAMKDANEQRKLQLNLQKEQYELERLQHQRTILVN